MQKILYAEFVLASGKAKWEAFKNMGRAKWLFADHSEISFDRAMGTGSGNGFSLWPDFSRYAFFIVFQPESDTEDFLAKNALLKWYRDHATSYLIAELTPIKAHGLWDGINPFLVSKPSSKNSKVAVLTRAKVRISRSLEFWRNVPKVSKFMKGQKAALHQTGIGEYPLLLQATLSIWTSGAAMRDAAYKNNTHSKIVQLTRKRNWYSEELFAEFEIRNLTGKGLKYEHLISPERNLDLPN